jgi:pimeloyl-ACP methyl ester carboxylesterase
MSTKAPLPKILCIHGAGSSGAIFRVQGRKVFHALRGEFQFVFVDAPFRSTAGPGMRPVFEDSGPFYRWQCDLSAAASFDITEEEIKEETRKVREYLESQLRSSENNTGRFVGVMAFSQGARVATGLLLYLEKKRREGRLDMPHMKFTILNSATYPPLFVDDQSIGTADSPAGNSTDIISRSSYQSLDKVNIPSIHIQGTNDPWHSESEKMRADFFDEALSTVIKFDGGHQVPVVDNDTNKIVAAIRQIAAQTL